MKKIYTCIILCIVLSTVGCVRLPPIVNNTVDINALDDETMSLRARSLEDKDIAALRKFNNLQHLDFRGGCAIMEAPITDQGVAELCELPLSHLEYLNLGYCHNLTDNALMSIGDKDWANLSWLMLFECPLITDAGIPHIANIETMEWLSFAYNTQLTGETLNSLSKLPNLYSIDLRGCTGLTNDGIEAIKQLQNIKWLNLEGCSSISANQLNEIQKALPDGVHLDVGKGLKTLPNESSGYCIFKE